MSSHIRMLSYLPTGVREAFISMKKETLYSVDEIRLRRGSALAVVSNGKNRFVSVFGELCELGNALVVDEKMLAECIRLLTNASRYALDDAIASGYIPLGGMRAGVCGRAVTKNGSVQTVAEITGIALRITRRVDKFAMPLYEKYKIDGLAGALVISPPSGGKTTFLRSLIYLLCRSHRVAVCDSRGELICEGLEKLPVDFMSFCPKSYAIEALTRTMTPEIIICDELGSGEEQCIMQNASCGVPIAASVHAASAFEAMRRPFVKHLCEAGIFKYAVELAAKDDAHSVSISEISGYLP